MDKNEWFDLECIYCGVELDEADKGNGWTHNKWYAWHGDCEEFHEGLIGSRGMALLQHVRTTDPDVGPWEITEEGDHWACEGQNYLVMDDLETDEKAQEGAEHCLDSVVIPVIPQAYRYWFDRDRWIADAVRHDGREFWVPSTTNTEWSSTWDGETYYIYEVN